MTIVGPELTRASSIPPSTPSSDDDNDDGPSPPHPLRLTVEECNATADSVYGLVDAVNRATLARVATEAGPVPGLSNKGEAGQGEAKASLKLGKADDVTLPWGKTLLAKPLIRLNAATLPPALAELLGRPTGRSAGVESATVLDGLVAWLDRALGDPVVRRRAEEEAATAAGRAAAEAAVATVVDEVDGEGEGVVEVNDRETVEMKKPALGVAGMGGPTGAGDVAEVAIADTEQQPPQPLLQSASSSTSAASPVKEAAGEEGAAGAETTEVEVQRTRLICVLETRADAGAGGSAVEEQDGSSFEAMKVLHQLRLYQIPHLARGLRFVGPSANPSLNAVAFNASAFLMNQRCVNTWHDSLGVIDSVDCICICDT